jgi:hypothetical protein
MSASTTPTTASIQAIVARRQRARAAARLSRPTAASTSGVPSSALTTKPKGSGSGCSKLSVTGASEVEMTKVCGSSAVCTPAASRICSTAMVATGAAAKAGRRIDSR